VGFHAVPGQGKGYLGNSPDTPLKVKSTFLDVIDLEADQLKERTFKRASSLPDLRTLESQAVQGQLLPLSDKSVGKSLGAAGEGRKDLFAVCFDTPPDPIEVLAAVPTFTETKAQLLRNRLLLHGKATIQKAMDLLMA
jgi:hypothetical protein